ncbi:hypothetical protein MRX96_019167 [Rhipicephalus microplus]
MATASGRAPPFGLAAHNRNPGSGGKVEVRTSQTSLDSSSHPVDPASERDRKIDDCRGGFVLKARSDEPPQRRRSLVEKSSNFKKSILQGLRIKKQHSTGDIDKRGVSSGSSLRSSGSNMSSASSESAQSGLTEAHTDSNASFVSQEDMTDQNVMETYMGEWKNDRRSGYGIAERSDGLKYEGEWYNNKKYGYGVTTFKDGAREEGKYKNNLLVTSGKKKHLFLLRSAKFRERVEAAVAAALRASQIALQKADIAISRTATARGKAEQADVAALHAKDDAEMARSVSKQFAPELYTPVDLLKKLAEVPDLAKLRVGAGGATPQRRRSLFQPTRAQELTAPQLDAAQQQLLNALTKAHQQQSNKPAGSRQGTPPVANAKPAPPLQPPPQVPVQHAQPVSLPQQLPQRVEDTMPQAIYGGADCTPDSGVSESMDGDSSPTRVPGGGGGRRSTLPNMPPDEGSHHRAASLYVAAPRRRLAAPAPAEALTRKKSLPNIADAAAAAPPFMSREEVSVLSSQRRDELRRMQEQAHRLRTNPLLYLFNS